MVLFILTLAPIALLAQHTNTAPDDHISLTFTQSYQFSKYKMGVYDESPVIGWEFMLVYPSSDVVDLIIYYYHYNSRMLSNHKYKYLRYNTDMVGVGLTIYFKK